MANVTLSIDEENLKRARIHAIEQGTSLNAVIRSFVKEEAAEVVEDLGEFPLGQVDKGIISRATDRHRAGEFSFWDCLIVEAALQSGCSLLLTEDMQNGRHIDTLEIRNPF